jgi:hypothetical protein
VSQKKVIKVGAGEDRHKRLISAYWIDGWMDGWIEGLIKQCQEHRT